MMKKLVVLILMVLMMVTFIGCDNQNVETKTTDGFFVEEGFFVEDGKIKVSLKANATTGFEWFYEIDDEEIVSFIDSTYEVNPHEENMVGVGGVYTALFNPLKDGSTTITFTYKRNWEDESSQIKRLLIEIKNGLISLQELSE